MTVLTSTSSKEQLKKHYK